MQRGDDNWYLGYLVDYPDYHTQGKTIEELVENLKDLVQDMTSGEIPYHKFFSLIKTSFLI
jgi:predicted RNase H-like HicB family nuclease